MLPVPSTKAERLVFQIPESGWLQAILEKLLFGLSSDQIRPMVENWTWHTPCQTSELFMDMLSTHSFLCWLRWTKSYQLIAKCNGNIAQLFYDSNLLLCRKPALYRQLNSSETPVWEPRSLITWRHVLFLSFFVFQFISKLKNDPIHSSKRDVCNSALTECFWWFNSWQFYWHFFLDIPM